MRTRTTAGITWNGLLGAAAGADLLVMAFAGVFFRDREALILSGLILLAIGFLRIRHGVASIAILGVISFDVLAWMAPAATKNIAGKQSFAAMIIPASLAAISVAGFIAATGSLFRGRAPDAGGRAAPVVLQVVIGAFVVSVIAALVQQRGTAAAAPQAGDVQIKMQNAAFGEKQIETTGPTITFAVVNSDLFWHTFTIDEPHVDIGLATRGRDRRSATFTPGTYTFYCRVPGHRGAGMEGTLVVR
jgi:plastocyanin